MIFGFRFSLFPIIRHAPFPAQRHGSWMGLGSPAIMQPPLLPLLINRLIG